MGINGARDNTLVIIGGVVILVSVAVGGIVAITLGHSDQVATIVPLLLTLVSTSVVGMLALIRSNKSVEVAQQSVEVAQETAVKTNLVAERLDGKLTAFIDAASRVAHDEGFREAVRQMKAEEAVHAKGVIQGKKEEQQRTSPPTLEAAKVAATLPAPASVINIENADIKAGTVQVTPTKPKP